MASVCAQLDRAVDEAKAYTHRTDPLHISYHLTVSAQTTIGWNPLALSLRSLERGPLRSFLWAVVPMQESTRCAHANGVQSSGQGKLRERGKGARWAFDRYERLGKGPPAHSEDDCAGMGVRLIWCRRAVRTP